MAEDVDINLTCRQCGKEFVFTKAERGFYELKGFAIPRRCSQCRSDKQGERESRYLACAQCGTGLEKGASTYCETCLANVQLEFELKTKQSRKEASAAHARLIAIESQKAELEEALRRKEQLVAELELKFDNSSQDLEKAIQFHAALEWLQPALNGIEKRLEALEHDHNKINERMLQLVQRMHELYDNTGLLDIVKRSLKTYPGQSTYSK